MTHDDLRTLLDFHYWARDRALDAVEALTAEQFTRNLASSFGSVRDTLAHIHAAEWIWLARWQGQTPTAFPPADRFPDLAAVRRDWLDLERQLRAYVDGLGEEGVSRIQQYTLLSGLACASPFWQMLQHVVNHASYHRGQVATMLRQLGAEPAKSCDMITFYRERG